MQAQSFILSARSMSSRNTELLAEGRLGEQRTLRAGMSQLTGICTLDALLATATPLPVADVSDESDIVHELLDRMYEAGPLDIATLEDSVVARAEATAGIERMQSFLVIRLSSEHEQHFRPTLRLLEQRLESIRGDASQILRRVETTELPRVVHRVWNSVVTMLDELRQCIKTNLAKQERLKRLYTRPSATSGEFGTWALESLTEVSSKQ